MLLISIGVVMVGGFTDLLLHIVLDRQCRSRPLKVFRNLVSLCSIQLQVELCNFTMNGGASVGDGDFSLLVGVAHCAVRTAGGWFDAISMRERSMFEVRRAVFAVDMGVALGARLDGVGVL